MPNIGGPGEAKRRMLVGVTNSIMLYAAPIWAGAMNVATYRGALQSVQRKMALRVIRGYRTVSYEAAVVIASMVPIHLLAAERKRNDMKSQPGQPRRQEREYTMRAWQEEWDGGLKGRWMHRLIRDLAAWTTRRHEHTNSFLTQWLTGHGSFKSYTRRISKTVDEEYETCGEPNTAEHAVFACERWAMERRSLCVALGEGIEVGTIIGLMLRSEKDRNRREGDKGKKNGGKLRRRRCHVY